MANPVDCLYSGACSACYKAGRGIKARFAFRTHGTPLPCQTCGSDSSEVLTLGRICIEQCHDCAAYNAGRE